MKFDKIKANIDRAHEGGVTELEIAEGDTKIRALAGSGPDCSVLEHMVTEIVTGIHLVEQLSRIAGAKPLSNTRQDLVFTGHAVEYRVSAGDQQSFKLSPGEPQHG